MKYCYWITKYDPRYRDETGIYRREEWTFFAQVGRRVGGRRFTMNEYLRVEACYLEALRLLLVEAGLDHLELRALWIRRGVPALRRWRTRTSLDVRQCLEFTRLALREQVHGQLIAPRRAYVQFGWDYYMYVGLSRPTPKALEAIAGLGLFADPWPSPYRLARRSL